MVRAHASFRGTYAQDTCAYGVLEPMPASEAHMHETHAIRHWQPLRVKAYVSFRCTYAQETDHKLSMKGVLLVEYQKCVACWGLPHVPLITVLDNQP